MKYQAKIDLHGYTLQNAYSAFADFVELCLQEGVKTALVVTGKGNPTELNPQTINYEFPHWCSAPAFRKYIKSVTQAEVKHGGQGAFYVRFR